MNLAPFYPGADILRIVIISRQKARHFTLRIGRSPLMSPFGALMAYGSGCWGLKRVLLHLKLANFTMLVSFFGSTLHSANAPSLAMRLIVT
jgi:hypothetical protein